MISNFLGDHAKPILAQIFPPRFGLHFRDTLYIRPLLVLKHLVNGVGESEEVRVSVDNKRLDIHLPMKLVNRWID